LLLATSAHHCSFYHLLFFSSLLIRRSPISTLFPYTTLFRSVRMPIEGFEVSRMNIGHATMMPTMVVGIITVVAPTLSASCPANGDRKSTRLNSSHVSISYAVFCLKKEITLALERTTTDYV